MVVGQPFCTLKINLEYYYQYPGVITHKVSVLTYQDEEGQKSRQGLSEEGERCREQEGSCL